MALSRTSKRSTAPIVAAAGLCLLAGPAAADSFADASRAYVAGDIAKARATWISLAHAGDADAAYRLGLLADLGQGTPESAGDAYRWYRRAAGEGDAAAEFNVAVMEDSGRGTAHDAADAATWYGRAAARGNLRAQYDLGLLYEAGDGVPLNPAAARAWFRMASAGGLPAARAKLENAPEPASARGPRGSQAPQPSVDTLRPAIPVAPSAGAIVAPGPNASTEIVWIAPGQPQPVRYFLQVVTSDKRPAREVHAGYADATATLAHLDPTTHRYLWRIVTVSPSRADYVASNWIAFSLHGLATFADRPDAIK